MSLHNGLVGVHVLDDTGVDVCHRHALDTLGQQQHCASTDFMAELHVVGRSEATSDQVLGHHGADLGLFVDTLDIHLVSLHLLGHGGVRMHAQLQLLADVLSGACQLEVVAGVRWNALVDQFGARCVLETFGHYDDVCARLDVAICDTAEVLCPDVRPQEIEVYRDFRDENRIGTSRNSSSEGSVAGVAAENLNDEDAVVRSASGGEITDELTNAVDRGVGSDTVGHEVEVHSLRGMDALDPVLDQVQHDGASVVASADHKGIDPKFLQTCLHRVILVGVLNLRDLHPRMAGFGACHTHRHWIQPLRRELHQRIHVHQVVQAGIAVGDHVGLHAPFAGHHGRTLDHRIETSAVTSAGDDGDLLDLLNLLNGHREAPWRVDPSPRWWPGFRT
mmetsp:Transcript_11564/g.27274  ORF Transcript_11564/g.27274 Transcript_11564/m.27274 type:complete len:391 (+) Transcript_11564:299-1471(+)